MDASGVTVAERMDPTSPHGYPPPENRMRNSAPEPGTECAVMRSAHPIDEPGRDGEAEARSDGADRLVALVQTPALERVGGILRGQSRPAVATPRAPRVDVLKPDGGSGGADTQRVLEQSVDHLAQPRRVGA